MEYVRLGRSSLKVSRLAFGLMGVGSHAWRTWVATEDDGKRLIAAAHERGINLFDTCDFYSKGVSEEILGKAISEMGVRDEVVIATKVGNPMGKGPNASGYSKKHIVEAAEASLRRLKTDRIDLYQTHIWDTSADIDEMVDAFDLLVRQGKVLYVGATDIPCWQLAQAVYRARIGGKAAFATLQHHYNAAWREDERDLIPFAESEGLGLLPYSPLARGLFAGPERLANGGTERMRTDEWTGIWYGREADQRVADTITGIAGARGVAPAQVALAWVLHASPKAVPIIGTQRLDHLDGMIAALSLTLSPDEMKAIGDAYEVRRRGGHF